MYEDAPEDLIFDRFEDTVYGGHPLGRPVLGYPETVRSLDRPALARYIDTHYAPSRLVVAVAGNVHHDQVVNLVRSMAETLERPGSPVDRLPAGGYARQEIRETRPIQQAHIVLGTRGIGLDDERRTTLNVLNTVLGGGMSSRLNQNIREKYGFCYNIYSFANLLSDTGDIGVYMGTDASRVDRAMKLIRRELDKVATSPVSNRQVNQAKTQLKGSLMLGLENMSNRMMRLGRVELTFGRYFSLDEITASIENVSGEDVRALAAELFDEQRLTSVVFVPSN